MRVCALTTVLIALVLLGASQADASQRVGLVDASQVVLRVDDRGAALILFTTPAGLSRRVVASGGIEAALPGNPQPKLDFDYAGGRNTWSFRDQCRDYDGPPLAHLVTACRAPDGSYWALQRWQRVQPLRGVRPFRPEHSSSELRISHWSGALGQLEVSPNWTYGGTMQGLFGRLTYRGVPQFGVRTPSASRSDAHARYVYIDTFNSPYGPGWKREAAKVTHTGTGGFCYSFAPIPPPPGYPNEMPKVPGIGELHRVTVVGPGLTPDIQWVGEGLGSFDPAADEWFNAAFDRLLAGDRPCRGER
jgi:hypothetical protein